MGEAGSEHGWQPPAASPLAGLSPEVRRKLFEASDIESLRLLASLIQDLADAKQSSANGQQASAAAQVKSLAERLSRAQEQVSLLEDEVRAGKQANADLLKQLDASEASRREIQKSSDDFKARLAQSLREREELDKSVTSKAAELSDREREVEAQKMQLERLRVQAGDRGAVESLERDKLALLERVKQTEADRDALRDKKNSEIDQLTARIASLEKGVVAAPDRLVSELWLKLIRADRSPVRGDVPPDPRWLERLTEVFMTLGRHVHNTYLDVCPVLDKLTKADPRVSRPWQGFKAFESFHETIEQIVLGKGGRNVGALSKRLTDLRIFVVAAMIADDFAFSSIADELTVHLSGPLGMGPDRNRKIKDFLDQDGQHKFGQRIVELRATKFLDAFSQGRKVLPGQE